MAKNKRTLGGHLKQVYKDYHRRAKRKNIEWKLTVLQLKKLVFSPCFYCGKERTNKKDDLFYNGIDRVVNDIGYVSGNVVSCCLGCNKLKSDRLTCAEALAAAQEIEAFRTYRKQR